MRSNLISILGTDFVIFAESQVEIWSMAHGAEIQHVNYGMGQIEAVQIRKDYIPLITVKFYSNSQIATFNSDAFKNGKITGVNVPPSLFEKLAEWKCQVAKNATHAAEIVAEQIRIHEESQIAEQVAHEDAARLRNQELEFCRINLERKSRIISTKFSEYGITSIWHITHKANINSILKDGILNHYDAYKINVNPIDISDPDAQRWRECWENRYHRKIHDYAPLYINPRNPMLYVRKHLQVNLCLVEVSLAVLTENEYLITDGNAASRDTQFYQSESSLSLLPWDVLRASYWTEFPDGKRKRCAG